MPLHPLIVTAGRLCIPAIAAAVLTAWNDAGR